MIINMNPHWRIRSDPLQWILERRPQRERKLQGRGKEWLAVGFFKTVARALREAAQRQVRELPGEYGLEALEPLCRQLSSIREDIEAVLITAGKERHRSPR